MMSLQVRDDFLKHVSEHRMFVVHESGVHRHLSFRRPSTIIHGFDIVTWPGYLCFCGDMGTFVFQRTTDMFQFFRREIGERGLSIDPGYWAQKVESVDRNGGLKEYSPEKAQKVIQEILDDEEQVTDSIRKAVINEVLSRVEDGEQALREAVNDFEREGFRFHDFWEHNLTEYTYRFLWCCYALVWGIDLYDKRKQVAPPSPDQVSMPSIPCPKDPT